MSEQNHNHDDGGPALPLQSAGPDFAPGYAGMSLRDYFAGQAMQALIPDAESTNEHRDIVSHYTANRAYQYADAMIARRNKQREGSGE